jgi:hypothetical protein
MDHRAQHLYRVDELVVEFDGSLRGACSRIATHEWREGKLEERISELEPYHLACRRIQQWIGCEDQEVDEAVVRRVEGDARKIAALESREAELESALRLILEEVDDPSRGSIHLSKPARDAARKALAKARGEVSDA